jgi:hypothetical protein
MKEPKTHKNDSYLNTTKIPFQVHANQINIEDKNTNIIYIFYAYF